MRPDGYEVTLCDADGGDTWFRWYGPSGTKAEAEVHAREAEDLLWRIESTWRTPDARLRPAALRCEADRSHGDGGRTGWLCASAMKRALDAVEHDPDPDWNATERSARRRAIALGLALSDPILTEAYADGLEIAAQINGRQGLGEEVGSIAYARRPGDTGVRQPTLETATMFKALGPWLVPDGQNREHQLAVLDLSLTRPGSATLRASFERNRKKEVAAGLTLAAAEFEAMGAQRLAQACARRTEEIAP